MSFPNPESIRAVSFDLGGTLIAAAPSVGTIYASVCRDAGIDVEPGRCDAAFEAAWTRRSAAVRGGIDRFSASPGGEDGWWSGVITEVLQACGVSESGAPPVEAFRAAFASPQAWRVFEDVRATFETLREHGHALVILSNWDSRLPSLLAALDLEKYFDGVHVSALAGIEKPNADFFRLAADGLGLRPAQILHVGDLVREDYRGATDAGMKALWINRRNGRDWSAGAGVAAPGVPAEHTITAIAGVAESLGLA